ncbi:MAG: RNA 2',3'-cyclic phosphodiesterase [Betaproteobacteria bacterium]|nr:RNA 2',3'-cyclic phosphodiesterase [Betaproteobacteria bacterium]
MFFALWPDERARYALTRWVEASYSRCGGRRMRSENLHITIAFLGMIERDRIDALARVAAKVASRKFDLVLDQPGYWKHNKIAWLGASEVPADLVSMVDELRGALTAGGFQFDLKPFVPHITLLRNARPPKEMPALDSVRWTVNGFVLLSSERDQAGPRYRVAAGPF